MVHEPTPECYGGSNILRTGEYAKPDRFVLGQYIEGDQSKQKPKVEVKRENDL